MTNQGLLTIINGDLGTTGRFDTGDRLRLPTPTAPTPSPRSMRARSTAGSSPRPPSRPMACPQDGTAVDARRSPIQARSDANDAFIALSPASLPGGQTPSGDGENLGSQTLAPGIYTGTERRLPDRGR
ncbi:MAG: ice-binding family protein [Gammaproteobacteria bacterium]|nr:ice-binding family protein [Gammaproteobacteria bacterium]